MIGIVLCSHSQFAEGLKGASEMIAGEQERFEAICFDGQEDLLDLGERIKEVSKSFTDGCIYVCDLLNGTPFNACALAIAETSNVILTGASLPMVIELLIQRNMDEMTIDTLVTSILSSNSEYVQVRSSKDFFGS